MNKPSNASVEQLKLPPHSIEAEQSVLGSMLIDPNSWDKVAEIVTETDFYNRSHRTVFGAILRLLSANQAVDTVTVKDNLDQHSQLEEAGGFSYLIELAKNTPSSANVTAYANAIKEKAIVRELIGVAHEIAEVGYNPEGRNSADILDLAESKVFEIAEKRTGENEGPKDVTNILTKTVNRLDALVKQGKEVTGVSSGYSDLDKKTSGLQPSDLIIVAARPSMGKCIVADSLLVNPKTGERQTIQSMVEQKIDDVISVSDAFKIKSAKVSQFVDDGQKPVYEVSTQLGKKIQTTLTHPFLTGKGWLPLAELTLGDMIAVPRALPIFGQYSASSHEVLQLCKNTLTCLDSTDNSHKAPHCALDEQVFTWNKASLQLVLNKLFDTISDVDNRCVTNPKVVLTTDCESLAAQLQHLLLRFGVLSTLASCLSGSAKCSAQAKLPQQFKLVIVDSNIQRLFDEIGQFGNKQQYDQLSKSLTTLLQLTSIDSSSTRVNQEDLIPSSVNDYILSLKGNRAWDVIFIATNKVMPPDFLKLAQGLPDILLSRQALLIYAELFDDDYLYHLSQSDIYWDSIVNIKFLGNKQVYDLTVPEFHNFIAQDVFVHNTTFAMNLCENAMMLETKPVLVFSLEMPAEQLMMRMLASLSRVNQTNIRTAQLDDAEWARISDTMKKLKNLDNLFIDDSSGLTPMELRTRARKLHRDRGGISLIMIDYLQLMRVPSLSENRTLEIAEISRSLKALAKELEVPVVALSQLNRGLEQRADKRPINSDLRESGSIEQDADLIMFIYRDEVYNENSEEKGVAEIIIGKQRNGPIGTSRLTFQGQFSRFDNYAGPTYTDDY